MSNPDWQPSFLTLWPTLVLRRELPDHGAHRAGLVALVEQMDREAEQMTSRYHGSEIFALDHPEIRWLRDGIGDTVRGYFREVGIDYEVAWDVRGWANVNHRGDYHSPHNHAWSYLSGTYYVRVPDQPSTAGGAGASASISFYDPRAAVSMLAVADEALGRSEHRVQPSDGTLLLWNAGINHSVHPNLAEQSRISISFNIVLG